MLPVANPQFEGDNGANRLRAEQLKAVFPAAFTSFSTSFQLKL